MLAVRPYLVPICVGLLVAPATFAADPPADPPPTVGRNLADRHSPSSGAGGWLGQATGPYRPKHVPLPDLSNSGRLESLMRAGAIYLSLQDCIALALENNLDIEIQRYGPPVADAGLLQALAGGQARAVSTSVTAGPTSAVAGVVSATSLSAIPAAIANVAASGPAIPTLDPALLGGASWAHATAPQSSAFLTGTNSLITRQDNTNVGIQKGFLTGATVSLGLTNSTITSNNMNADFNPATSATLSLNFTQHLLQGFGWGLNSRQIRIARNNREVSDLTFKLQVITTVTAVMELYWDLVAFHESVRVAEDALSASQKLLDDNKRQVEVGTLAPIEVIRAEAQIATGEQNLLVVQAQVLQQETIIKTALSRTGVASPAVAEAHIIPTDPIRMPDVEPAAPIQELNALALASRPELAQTRIQLRNQELVMKGSKNGLLPTLDVVASLANNALAGQVNPIPAPAGSVHSNTPFFIGGYSTVLTQLFARNFPNYSAGFNLSMPIGNRAAQAQAINDELTYRQQQLGLQRLENQVRVDVQNALIGLTQARAQYQAAVKGVRLQQESLDAEQKKLALGASTTYNVILMQRDLVTAQSSQVTAEAAYVKARVELDRATGQILNNNGISLDEAFKGVVSRPPDPIPPPDAQQAPAPRR